MNKLLINNVYRTKKGELVVFLGYQDGESTVIDGVPHWGFFRELKNVNTFFGLPISDLILDDKD